jgi:hypothetical protein
MEGPMSERPISRSDAELLMHALKMQSEILRAEGSAGPAGDIAQRLRLFATLRSDPFWSE